jgi:hypothetical protein
VINVSCRFTSPLLALAFLVAGCGDSGRSLGNSQLPDAGSVDGSIQSGGSAGTGGSAGAGGSAGVGGSTAVGGSTVIGGSTGSGGVTAGTGGGGGTNAASDAGAVAGDDAVRACVYRGESCTDRPCCSPLVCLTLSNPPSCYESLPPPPDSGSVVADASVAGDTLGASDGSGCPVCPPMKCAYGSPVDGNGCTVCTCNPAPDGGEDASAVSDATSALDAGVACPPTPPASGGACVGQASCFYDVCPSAGRTQATCTAGAWVVETAACGQVSCQGNYAAGRTCSSGEVCLVQIGGTLVISCIANPCGTGPASPECTTFTTGCTPMFDLSSGVTYYCNTCPSGTCA